MCRWPASARDEADASPSTHIQGMAPSSGGPSTYFIPMCSWRASLGPADSGDVLIRIEGTQLPGNSCGPSPERPGGHRGIHVGVQRRNKPGELLGLTPGDAPAVTWTLDAVVTPAPDGGADLKGPYIQGPPGGRSGRR